MYYCFNLQNPGNPGRKGRYIRQNNTDMIIPMRRKDRELDREQAFKILEKGEYGVLSLCDLREYGYGIPLSYACLEDKIYFHCAQEGYTLECLRKHPDVSFCVVGETKILPEKFSTAYESVIALGKISEDIPQEEALKALELLIEKYSPDFRTEGAAYIQKAAGKTKVLRMDIRQLSGKARRTD